MIFSFGYNYTLFIIKNVLSFFEKKQYLTKIILQTKKILLLKKSADAKDVPNDTSKNSDTG